MADKPEILTPTILREGSVAMHRLADRLDGRMGRIERRLDLVEG